MMKKAILALALPCLLHAGDALADVRINKVANQNLGTWSMTSMNGNDPVCVRNTGGSAYTIMPTDNSTLTPGGFYLENTSSTAQIPYTVRWGNTPAPGTVQIFDGVSHNATGASSHNTCNGGDSANYRIDINNSDMASVPAGTYKATLTLVAGQ